MRLPWVPYKKVVYVDAIVPDVVPGYPSAGRTTWFTIQIRKDWADNTGVLAHELAHVQLNYLKTATLGLIALVMGRRWKLWTEARAYAIQTKYPNRDGGYLSVDDAAERLRSPIYDLGLTHVAAVAEISAYL